MSGNWNVFQKQNSNLKKIVFKQNSNNFEDNEQVTIMKNMLFNYTMIVKDQIFDYVPKIILSMYFMDLLEDLEKNLTQDLSQQEYMNIFANVDTKKLEEAKNTEQEIEKLT